MYLFLELKLKHSKKNPLQSEIKKHKNLNFWSKFVKFQVLGVCFLISVCFYWFGGLFANLNTFYAKFSYCKSSSCSKSASPKISKKKFEIFTNFHDFAMNIMGIKTKNAKSCFQKKSIYGTYTAHHELKDTLRIH